MGGKLVSEAGSVQQRPRVGTPPESCAPRERPCGEMGISRRRRGGAEAAGMVGGVVSDKGSVQQRLRGGVPPGSGGPGGRPSRGAGIGGRRQGGAEAGDVVGKHVSAEGSVPQWQQRPRGGGVPPGSGAPGGRPGREMGIGGRR